MNPKIGILIITHNESARVAQTLNSVLAQKNVNYQVFISDNNSTDRTLEAVESNFNSKVLITARREEAPLKSVYAHSARAYEFFLENNSSINFWIILNAGDSWRNSSYLENLLSKFMRIDDLNKEAICSYSAVEVCPYGQSKTKVYRNDFSNRNAGIRLIKYWLFPRYRQPLTFFFGLMNRSALQECVDFSYRVENYRNRQKFLTERSPEAEMFFSFRLITRIQFFFSPNDCIRYGIHQPRLDTSGLLRGKVSRKTGSVGHYRSILKSHSFPVYYFQKIQSELTFSERAFITIFMPIKLFIEYSFNFGPILYRRLLSGINRQKHE